MGIKQSIHKVKNSLPEQSSNISSNQPVQSDRNTIGVSRKSDLNHLPTIGGSSCCSLTIFKAIQHQPTVRQVRWDIQNHTLEIEYRSPLENSKDESQSPEQSTLNILTQQLSSTAGFCKHLFTDQHPEACEPCLEAQRVRMLGDRDCQDHVQDQGGVIEFKEGVVTIAKKPSEADTLIQETRKSPWLTKKMYLDDRIKGIPVQDRISHTQINSNELSGKSPSFQQPISDTIKDKVSPITTTNQYPSHHQKPTIPWEPIFVGITFLAMIVGVIANRIGFLPVYYGAYLVAYLFGGYFGVRASFESLREKKIDIDLLMVLAALGAAGVGAPFEGALLLFLFSLSNVLQDYALDRTRSAIKALAKLKPDTAILLSSLDDQQGQRVKVDSVQIGSLVQVKPGDRIPLDGIIQRGFSLVDQSSITGESMPLEKQPGSTVLAGTMNQDGEFVFQVTKTSNDSTIAKVITLVEEAREQQAKTERFLDTFEQYYAILVIVATLLAVLVPPLLFGRDWAVSIYQAITLMVAASPCALIISTPASILSSIGNGARKGILFKGGVHVEQAANIQAVAFDKTGTLTRGKPAVTQVLALQGSNESEVLRLAAALESKSQHILAHAILEEANNRGIHYPAPTDFKNTSGVGVQGQVEGRRLLLSSPNFLKSQDQTKEIQTILASVQELQARGATVVVLAQVLESAEGQPGSILGLIALEDSLKPEVPQVIQDLRDAGIKHVVMLTGDNEAAAKVIAAQAGIDVVFPELLPEHKLEAIRKIEATYGPTAMVGDGVNDAPALAGARLGIAMGAAGTDAALETADVVLLSDDLSKIPYLIALSRKTKQTLIVNLTVALGLMLMMVVGIYTIGLPLPLAVIGHEGGTVLVSLNGVRLLMFKQKKKRLRSNP
jgi:Cd2+/Zn2+-exporting ATPase